MPILEHAFSFSHRQGDFNKINSPSHPLMLDGCFPPSDLPLWRNWKNYELFLLGSKKNGRHRINWLWSDKLTLKFFGGLGFHDMEAFNLSMLGKKSWKLLTDSSTLLTRVPKAKYSPRRDFLDAPIGHNPSYTWRSLWSTQHLLTLGYRWKIGDGSKINVWNMPWIQNLPSLKPSTPPLPHYKISIVNPNQLS